MCPSNNRAEGPGEASQRSRSVATGSDHDTIAGWPPLDPHRQVITYADPLDRPEVEVLVQDVWYFGILRQWVQDAAGEWHGNVAYTVATAQTYVQNVPADRLRPYQPPPVGMSD